MAKIIHHCPTCHKQATTQSESHIMNTLIMRTYQCGHSEMLTVSALSSPDTLDITSLDNKKLFPFQLVGAQFLEKSNGRALLADGMGLGKTVQFIAYIVAHPEVRPCVLFVKSGLRIQWHKECVRWGDLMCQVIEGGKTYFLPGMDCYIISMDSAWRIESLSSKLKGLQVKTVLIDECQGIKNGNARRTQAIRLCTSGVDHVIGLSGTPIKNNASEYFPILNTLRPDKFPSERQFIYGWCDSYYNGYGTKTGGLREPKRFLEFTKDFILRREREDVLPDLPRIFRQYSFHELGSLVEDAYTQTVREFQDFYSAADKSSFATQSSVIAYLSKMRHLTGIAKVSPICDYVSDFLTSTERKIVIFIHHKDVGQALYTKLSGIIKENPSMGSGVLEITSSMDAYQRDNTVMKLLSPDYRVAIMSTLAAGEGLNLQPISDCIIGERQWNPPNEEQAEARFPRPGSTADKINATYFIAVGTVDEFFTDLVEKKREILNSTLKGEAIPWNETNLIRELAEVIAQKGGQKWGF